MGNFKRVFLFPIETIVRELDAKLFLAAELCARGSSRIYLGHQGVMLDLAQRMRNVTYCGKNVFVPHHPNRTAKRYGMMKANGIKVVYLDEEGAVYFGEEADWKRALLTRIDPRTLEAGDFICAWGDFQRETLIEANPRLEDAVVATGHPRFDLYSSNHRRFFETEIQQIRNQYGHFILVNTNQGYANHRQGAGHLFTEHFGYVPDDKEKRTQLLLKWSYSHRLLAHFIELVHRIANEFPDRKIVIRPHPSEDHEFYRIVTRGLEAVEVVHEGPVGPWLMACDLLIHDGCTTAVEGHLCGADIINFKPIVEAGQDLYLPNVFGKRCQTLDEVIACIREKTGAKVAGEERVIPKRALRLLKNLEAPAIPKVADVVQRASESAGSQKQLTALQLNLQLRRIEATETAKEIIRPLFRKRRASAGHSQQKFPGLTKRDIEERFERVRLLTNSDAAIRLHSPYLTIVES